MNIHGQGNSLTLAQDHSVMKIKACFSQKLLGHTKNFRNKEMKIYYEFGHKTNMAAMSVYMVKSFKKPSSPEPMD